jgi:hypothetical protein
VVLALAGAIGKNPDGVGEERKAKALIDHERAADNVATSDDHRYYPFPYGCVFDGALHVLSKMGYIALFSNIYLGRIIVTSGRGRDALGRMDLRIVGRGKVTFVHIDSPRYSMTGSDFMDEAKQRFFWRLDDWLHTVSPNEMMWVHRKALDSYGSPDVAYVPRDFGTD